MNSFLTEEALNPALRFFLLYQEALEDVFDQTGTLEAEK